MPDPTVKRLVRKSHLPPQHFHDPLTLPRNVRRVRFYHPGYSNADALLLSLPALDRNGIHHQTALDVCAIVANNRWDGFFTADREGRQQISRHDLDVCLDKDEYYFQVPGYNGQDGSSQIYPVIPRFADWPFPHATVPQRYSQGPDLRAPRPDRCCLSQSVSLLENAHIVPSNPADATWFDQNGMSQYGDINSQANLLRLKVDVHQFFDRKPKFAIVPKNEEMVVHIFNDEPLEAVEAIEMFQNVPVPLQGQDYRFVLARLAWTIFPLLDTFLKKRVARTLLRSKNNTLVEEVVTGQECYQHYGMLPKPRSLSPAKRSATQMEASANEENEIGNSGEECPCTGCCDCGQRGRKRRYTATSTLHHDTSSTASRKSWSSSYESGRSFDHITFDNLRDDT